MPATQKNTSSASLKSWVRKKVSASPASLGTWVQPSSSDSVSLHPTSRATPRRSTLARDVEASVIITLTPPVPPVNTGKTVNGVEAGKLVTTEWLPMTHARRRRIRKTWYPRENTKLVATYLFQQNKFMLDGVSVYNGQQIMYGWYTDYKNLLSIGDYKHPELNRFMFGRKFASAFQAAQHQ